MEQKDIDNLIDLTQKTATLLYMNNAEQAQQNLGLIISNVSGIYTEMIADTIRYNNLGIEIPGRILCDQIQNLSEAVAESDIIAIADTLMYEIKEGLMFYREVKQML